MCFQVFLVLSLLLSGVFAIPLYDSALNNEEKKEVEVPTEKGKGQMELNNAERERSTSTERTKQSDDLMGQETFYPIGGVWWGYRPWGGWGGWGGYRPWHGWHGWHGWHRPHWGGNWGGHWGGGGWGRSTS